MPSPRYSIADIRRAFLARQLVYQRKADAALASSLLRLNSTPTEVRRATLRDQSAEMYQHTADSLPYLFFELTGEHLNPEDPE